MSAGNAGVARANNNLDTLAPKFRQAVEKAIAECAARNLDAMVYEAYRSQELQSLYYCRGRTIIPPHSTVTNAASNCSAGTATGLPSMSSHDRENGTGPSRGSRRLRSVSRDRVPLGRRVEDEGSPALSVGSLQAESFGPRARADRDGRHARRVGGGERDLATLVLRGANRHVTVARATTSPASSRMSVWTSNDVSASTTGTSQRHSAVSVPRAFFRYVIDSP